MRMLRKQLASVATNVDWPALRIDIITAGGLGCAGDLVCQSAVEGESIDWRRFFAVSSFEALYMGGLFHFLCQAFPLTVCAVGRQLPAQSWLGGRLQATGSAAHAFGCAVVDNIHDGALMLPSYFIGVGLLQGDSLEQARSNLRTEWLNSYLVGAGFWLPVMSINFAIIPPHFRVRTMALANVAWSVIIDFMAHRSQPRAIQREAAVSRTAQPLGKVEFDDG